MNILSPPGSFIATGNKAITQLTLTGVAFILKHAVCASSAVALLRLRHVFMERGASHFLHIRLV